MSGRNTLKRCAIAEGQSRKVAWGRTVGGQVLAQQSDKRVAHTHPTPYANDWHAGSDAGTKRMSREWGWWALGHRASSSSTPCPSLPRHEHHHKVLIRETWGRQMRKPMQTSQSLFPMGLGAVGRDGSDHRASCLQSNRQRRVDVGPAAKPPWAHTPPRTQDTTSI